MFRNYTYLTLVAALAVTGCSTTQDQSPYYTSNPATAAYSSSQAPAYTQQASYSSSANLSADQNCRRKETNRELIGGAVGGTAGAFVGKELIGGTKGVVAGAALGGIAGYGIGDISTNCSPAAQTYSGGAYSDATQSNAGYQSAPSYSATPAGYNSVSCPTGTISQSNGTCLLESSLPDYKARTAAVAPTSIIVAPTSTYQQYDTTARTVNVVTANTLMTPSSHMGTDLTRQLGGSSYQVGSGDTVYSLARKHCVTVKDIQSANGLDSNYGIKIGQTLQLPSNRC